MSVYGEFIDLWYSGKARTHGGNIQAVLAPDGFPLRISAAEPGSVHDITAARVHALPALTAPPPPDCRPSPTPVMTAPASAFTSRSSGPRAATNSIPASAPATPSSARCAAWENADSP